MLRTLGFAQVAEAEVRAIDDGLRSELEAYCAGVNSQVHHAAALPIEFQLLRIDFECPYYVHPGMQVWDFCLIQDGGLYQIFYHGILEEDNHPRYAHNIYRATSEDLRHWSAPEIVLSISDEPHEAEAIWAPDVVFDDETGLWWMAYTGVDFQFNQRICMAWSRDLVTWYKSRANPVLEPDSSIFFYYPSSGWAECRDPYLYREDGQWHMLTSAKAGDGILAVEIPDGAVRLEATDCGGESAGSARGEVDGEVLPKSSAKDAATISAALRADVPQGASA